MSLEQGKIGNWQFILLMMGLILGSSIVLVPGTHAKHDAWIAIIMGMIEGASFVLIYSFLSNKFKGKNLIQIHEIVYGPYLGKLVSLFFLWFIFHVGSLTTNTFKYFFSNTILPQTPDFVLVLLIIAVCAYAAKNGIEVIARCAFVLVLTAIVSFMGSSLLLIKNFQLTNLFPIFETPLKELLIAAHGAAVFPFGQIVVFMMIIPYLNNNKRSVIYPVITALLLGGLFLIGMSIRNIGVLGPMNNIYVYPTFQADRLINVGNLLSRLEILTVIGFLTMGFIRISIFLYALSLGSAQLLGLKTYRPLVVPLGILMAIVAVYNFKNFPEDLVFAERITLVYLPPFELGIPLLTLIVALIRRLPKKKDWG